MESKLDFAVAVIGVMYQCHCVQWERDWALGAQTLVTFGGSWKECCCCTDRTNIAIYTLYRLISENTTSP